MDQYLSPAEAAAALGISAKALRLYEERGLVRPLRSASGWRTFGPEQMRRAREVAALRRLGFSLAQTARVLGGDAAGIEPLLAAHQAALETDLAALASTIDRVRLHRESLARGAAPDIAALVAMADTEPSVALTLPWPWGGETFALRTAPRLTYLVGPLGSGKTVLARQIAATLPGAGFVELDRHTGIDALRAACARDDTRKARVDAALAWLGDEGATPSDALFALVARLEAPDRAMLVVDLIEQGLDAPTQAALGAWLKHRRHGLPRLIAMTRSSAILDLEAVGPDEAIIHCPANHAPPGYVAPRPGAPGYEAVRSCLASPEVRRRTEGVVAMRPAGATA